MQTKIINPYAKLGAKHTESLDYIIAHLPVSPTFDDLNNRLAESFFMPDPADPSPIDATEGVIKTLLPHAYNGYVNGALSMRLLREEAGATAAAPDASRPGELIQRMLHDINTVPVEAIGEFLTGMEEEIVAGGLSYAEQIPLLITTQMGKSDYEYWQAQMATPGPWSVYLDADNTINYLHVAGWVNAAIQGALLTYGLLSPPRVQFFDLYSSVISATGLAAGKVMWGWVGK